MEVKAIEGQLMVGAQESLEAQVKGEIDAQVSTAKMYPREVSRSIERIQELAARDVETAEKCFYALPRGNKTIEGPSVRMAEIVAHSWGNLRAVSRVIAIDNKFVTVQGGCIDLETNFGASVEVKRRITDKDGRRFNDDMIAVTSNAACAIAFRNAVFKVVPGALIKSVMDKVKKVAAGDEKTFGTRLMNALHKFKELGANMEDVYRTIGVREKTDISIEHLRVLHGFLNAIEEGTTTIEEAFAQPKKGKDLSSVPNGGRMSMKRGGDESHPESLLSSEDMEGILGALPKKRLNEIAQALDIDPKDTLAMTSPGNISKMYAAYRTQGGGK